MIAQLDLPYPGLRAFARDENVLFFGREGCVDQMLSTLAQSRFLAVLGASGSGKSSLVRTGLLNALERGALIEAGSDWLVADFHPGQRPLRSLAEALSPKTADEDHIEALEDFLGQSPLSLVEWVQVGNLAPGRPLLLLADQFEEMFRYDDYVDREAMEAFVALLLHSAASQDAPIYVVITMRSEYLGACALIPDLAERINDSLYLTPRMDRESCRQAIEGPANLFDFTIEPRLVNEILNDMARFAPFEKGEGGASGGPGPLRLSRRADQLPLMQHLLNRLWTRARTASQGRVTLTFADYQAIGGLEGALDSHGAAILEALPAETRPAVETVFRALVAGSDPSTAVRRPTTLQALTSEAGPAATVVVEAFRSRGCNFLRPEPHTSLASDTLIDISHESLIRQWSLLADWTTAEARAEERWTRLMSSAERWSTGQGGLLSGLDLATLTHWWDEAKPSPAWAQRHGGGFDDVATYLQTSQATEAFYSERRLQRTRRERNRLLIFSSVAGALAVVAAGALIMFAVQGRNLKSQGAELATIQTKIANAGHMVDLANQKIADADKRATDAQARADKIDEQNKQALEKAAEAMTTAANREKETEAKLGASQALLKDNNAKADAATKKLADVQAQADKLQARQKADYEALLNQQAGIRRAMDYCHSERTNDPVCNVLLGRDGAARH